MSIADPSTFAIAPGYRANLSPAYFDDDTLLRRRPGHPCVLVDKGERLEVLLGDRALDVPARLRPALDLVRNRAELRPRDLPLDEQSRLVLARRLVREGLLRVVAP